MEFHVAGQLQVHGCSKWLLGKQPWCCTCWTWSSLSLPGKMNILCFFDIHIVVWSSFFFCAFYRFVSRAWFWFGRFASFLARPPIFFILVCAKNKNIHLANFIFIVVLPFLHFFFAFTKKNTQYTSTTAAQRNTQITSTLLRNFFLQKLKHIFKK